jgi:hypothetical protein
MFPAAPVTATLAGVLVVVLKFLCERAETEGTTLLVAREVEILESILLE